MAIVFMHCWWYCEWHFKHFISLLGYHLSYLLLQNQRARLAIDGRNEWCALGINPIKLRMTEPTVRWMWFYTLYLVSQESTNAVDWWLQSVETVVGVRRVHLPGDCLIFFWPFEPLRVVLLYAVVSWVETNFTSARQPGQGFPRFS